MQRRLKRAASLFKHKKWFKLFEETQELCKGALPTPGPVTSEAATYLSSIGGNACLFWKGFVLHITNGNIQLRLRPQSSI